MARRVRRQFDEPFKRAVVEQVECLGRSRSSVARNFELDPKVLRRWLREYANPQHIHSALNYQTPIEWEWHRTRNSNSK